jgi:uncharacterized protein (DUF4415 family)
MRLDADVIDAYNRAKWQSRINSDLRKVMKLG